MRKLLGHFRQLCRRRPGNWLGQIEQRCIFALAEILRLKKLGQADDLCAPRPAASRTRSIARCRFSSGSDVVDICTSPTRNFSGGKAATSLSDEIEYQFPILARR